MKATHNSSLQSVREHIAKKQLLSVGDRVLCALSGGADSVALLLFLSELSSELEITVYAAHLNHGIRGAEADRDERFCSELCKKLGVQFVSEKADVPRIAKDRKIGLEEAAREVRYAFLDRVAEELGCNKICTAHHADDNIETVLLHMIRGCGLDGLKGIACKRGNIIRPLLILRKQELVDAVNERGYTFVHDSTNDENDNTRNYIRHHILPHIYELNGSADKTFYRMCSSIEKDSEYLNRTALEVSRESSREQLAQLDDAVIARYIRALYEEKTGKTALDSESVNLICRAIKEGKTVKYDVQCAVSAYVSHSGIDFVAADKECVVLGDTELDWGENIISPIGYKILTTKDKNIAQSFTNVNRSAIQVKVKADKITVDNALRVSVRTAKSGDSYVFGKMSRCVRRQLINFKIPKQKRASLPVFCTEGEIFYVCGLRLADRYAAKGEDDAVYIVCAEIN